MKKLTIEEFNNRGNLKHEGKYDYSSVKYINAYIKIKIICPIHGEFEQIPMNHLNGYGCKKCSSINVCKTNKDFIENSIKKHGDKYNYSLVKYVNNITKVKIICHEHGVFQQIPNNHLTGSNCPKCPYKTTNEFIIKADEIHDNIYDYCLFEYTGVHNKGKIICKKHGIFEQTPHNHNKGKGCPSCKESKGEKEITRFLSKNNFKFYKQHKFEGCKNILPLSFDFYLSELNICVEYDGIQHFKPVEHFGGLERFIIQQKIDKLKERYCKKNNINLIRIKHNENIYDKLLKLC